MAQKRGELTLSFLDALCNGLGATIMIFIIFVVLNHEGSRESGETVGVARDQVSMSGPGTTQDTAAPSVYEILLEPSSLMRDPSALELRLVKEHDGIHLMRVRSKSATASFGCSYLCIVDNTSRTPGDQFGFEVRPNQEAVRITVEAHAGFKERTRWRLSGKRGTGELSLLYSRGSFSAVNGIKEVE